MHKRFPAPITFLFVCFFLLTGARGAEAKSVSWTSSIMPNLAYYWNHGTGGSWSGEGVTPETAGCAGGTLSCGWATALQGASAAIIYKARIINVALVAVKLSKIALTALIIVANNEVINALVVVELSANRFLNVAL